MKEKISAAKSDKNLIHAPIQQYTLDTITSSKGKLYVNHSTSFENGSKLALESIFRRPPPTSSAEPNEPPNTRTQDSTPNNPHHAPTYTAKPNEPAHPSTAQSGPTLCSCSASYPHEGYLCSESNYRIQGHPEPCSNEPARLARHQMQERSTSCPAPSPGLAHSAARPARHRMQEEDT